jgi:serine/threonine protein kinase
MAKLVHLSPGDELANGRYRVEREMNRAHVRLVEHKRRRVALSRQVRTCAGGGTAIIYAAVDRAESESRVALKVVPLQPSAAMPSGALCREVQYAQILRHENIARCLGAFHAAHIGAFVIVTELVDGIDLLEFLNSRTDPLSEACASVTHCTHLHP